LTNQEKVELINTLHNKVVDYDCEEGICLSVLVPLDENTKKVLKQLGKNENWIERNKISCSLTESDVIDLTSVGFEFAKWWDSEQGFSLEPKQS